MAKSVNRGTSERTAVEAAGTRYRADGAEGSQKTPKGPRKSLRRRQIDPTTCDREYSAEEREFMRAMETYKRSSGRMFPTCSEILEVLKTLGYRRDELALTPDHVAN